MLRPGVHEMNSDAEDDVYQLMLIFAQHYETLFPLSVIDCNSITTH
jgi:hypothetical protein